MPLLPGPIECNITLTESANGNDCKQHTFPADKRTGDKTMRVQIAACLLCLMILVGSFDSLPDPPAVQPQRSQNNLVPQRDYPAAVAAENHASDCLTCAPVFRPACFRLARFSKVEDLPTTLPLYVKRQTPPLPVFLKDGFPQLTKYRSDRYRRFETESGPRSLSREACKQATHSQTVHFACGREKAITDAHFSNFSSMGQDSQR